MKRTFSGFTLIEVLITLVIIAVLVSITVIALNPGDKVSKANDTKIKADITQLANAYTLFRNDVNSDPFTAAVSGELLATGTDEDKSFCDNIVGRRILSQVPFAPGTPASGLPYHFTNCDDFRTGYTATYTPPSGGNPGTITFTGTLSTGTVYSLTR